MVANAIDLKKLRAFYMVAKHGSLRNAAARLLLSTSAVSIQISQLEKELGVRLFDRVGRRLVLEPTGLVFLKHVEKVLEAVDDAVASVSKIKAARRRISIALGTDLTRFFSPAIADFMKTHPDIDIALTLKHSPETLARILDGDIDMGVGYFSKLPKDLAKRALMKSGFSLFLSTSHPLANVKSPTLADIGCFPLIALRLDTDMGHRILRAFSDAAIEPPNILEVGNCQSSHELARQGIGIAVAHTICLEGYPSSEMREIDASHILGNVDIAVVHRKQRDLSSAHRELLEQMVAASEGILSGRPGLAAPR